MIKKCFFLNVIGYWSEKYENGVTPAYLCGNYAPQTKEKIVNYLKSGIRGVEFMGCARCRFECEYSHTKDLGNTDMTDGSWVWPEGLSHYVEKHNLLLPPEFVAHMKKNNYKFPKIDPDFIKIYKDGEIFESIEVKGSKDIWKTWLKEMGEDEYLLNPIIAKQATPIKPEVDVFDAFFKAQKEKEKK